MFYSELEIETLKKDIFFNSKDVEKRLEKMINCKDSNSDNDFNIIALKNEYEKIKQTPLEDIKMDFSKRMFYGYCIDYCTGEVKKVKCDDLYFVYDNKNHELYLSSFTWYD